MKKMMRFFAWLSAIVKVFWLQDFFCMHSLYKEENMINIMMIKVSKMILSKSKTKTDFSDEPWKCT